MLAGSKKRETTTSPAIQAKLNDYLAEQNLHTPAERVFKQVERKQSQTFYLRSLFGGLAGFAFLALLGAIASIYVGYSILASSLVCSILCFGAIPFWLNKTIPEVKVSACAPEKLPCNTPVKSDISPQSPNILFRGVPYTISHEPSNPLVANEQPSLCTKLKM